MIRVFFACFICIIILACSSDESYYKLPETCVSLQTGAIYKLQTVINFVSYGIEDIQSCPIDKKNKRYIHLKGDKVANVFNYEGDYKYQMNLQDFGHENDAYIEDDCLYTIDGSSSNYDGLLEVYEYDFQKENFRTNTYDLGKSNSLSLIGGICKYSMRYHLIVAYNLQGNDRLFSNKVQIFTLDKKLMKCRCFFAQIGKNGLYKEQHL